MRKYELLSIFKPNLDAEEVDKLIEKLKIPVVTTFNGFDLLETNNKYYYIKIYD